MTDPESRGQPGSCLPWTFPSLTCTYPIQPAVRCDPEADMSEPEMEEVHLGNARSCWQYQHMSILDMKRRALGDYMGCGPNVETDTLVGGLPLRRLILQLSLFSSSTS